MACGLWQFIWGRSGRWKGLQEHLFLITHGTSWNGSAWHSWRSWWEIQSQTVRSYQQCLFWLFQHMVKYPHYLPTDTRDANFDKGSIKLDLKDIDLKRLSFEIERERYWYACGANKEEYINCGKYRKEKFLGNQQVTSLTPQDSVLVVRMTGGLLLNWWRLCLCKTCCFTHRKSFMVASNHGRSRTLLS